MTLLHHFVLIGALAGASASAAATPCCDVLELRQYLLHPGGRDAFIPLFEREFIETQEAVGNTVIGQFRDLDAPDRFAWLRGFKDMPSRAAALQAFYGGPVWQAHRDEANAFFIDTDDVLLLHAVAPRAALDLDGLTRAAPGATEDAPGLLVATVYSFAQPVDRRFVRFFERDVLPELRAAHIDVRGWYASETAPNNFPRLPVRADAHVFVWFALYRDADDHAARRKALEAQPGWKNVIAPGLEHRTNAPAQTLRLKPTPRSLLHG